MIALAALALGLAVGVACGGSIDGLTAVNLRHEWLLLLLFTVQVIARGRIAGTAASSAGIAVWVLSCVALIVLLCLDGKQPGIWVAGMGIALNLIVVLLNGGMPVAVMGSSTDNLSARVSASAGFYQLAGPGTVFGAFGDVVLLAVGGAGLLTSPGDILLSLGVIVFVLGGMMSRGPAVATQDR